MFSRIKDNNFKIKNNSFKILIISMMVLFVLSLGTFIATSFYKIDLLISEKLDDALRTEIGKYFSQGFSAAGLTELLAILFVLLAIVMESYGIYLKNKRVNLKNHEGIIYTLYTIVFIAGCSFNIGQAVNYNYKDKGFGPGIDNEIMDSYKYKQTAKIICFIIQTSFMLFSAYFIRFKLSKRPDFISSEYGVDALKGIAFFGISYIIVALFKGGFGRMYFYNVIFGDLLEELNKTHPEMVDHYMSQNTFIYGFNDDGNFLDGMGEGKNNGINNYYKNIPGDGSGYRAQGSFAFGHGVQPANKVPGNSAFPSGHVDAAFCVGSIFFLFLGRKQTKKSLIILKILMFIGFLDVIGMGFGVVIMRGHGMSDVSFINMGCIISFPLANLLINKILSSISNKDKK